MHEGGRTLLRAFRGGAGSGAVGGLIEGALSRRETLLPAAPGPEQDLLQGKAGLQTAVRPLPPMQERVRDAAAAEPAEQPTATDAPHPV